MTRSTAVILAAVLLALLAPGAGAASVWAQGVSATDGWYDAEKASDVPDDTLLCWAASAANILLWSGWDGGYIDEDAMFAFMVAEDEEDAGGWQSWGWRWWFYGDKVSGHFDDSSHAGFYSLPEYTAAYASDWTPGLGAMDVIKDLLLDGYGVGIAVKGSCYHAITVWGVDIDDTGAYTGIYVTDSDNDKYGPHPRSDTLDYYPVYASGGVWHLDGMCSDPYIKEIDALKMYEVIPEPGTMLLLGVGLAGLVVVRRRRRRT